MTERGAREPTIWHSCEEIEFIKSLKPDVLVKYNKAIEHRVNWYNIEPEKIYAFLGKEWKGDKNAGTSGPSLLSPVRSTS